MVPTNIKILIKTNNEMFRKITKLKLKIDCWQSNQNHSETLKYSLFKNNVIG